MQIDQIMKKVYEWMAHLSAELVRELRKDKADVLKKADEVRDTIIDSNERSLIALDRVHKELKNKGVEITNPEDIKGDIVIALESVVSAIREEVKKLDKDIVINTDLEPLLDAVKDNKKIEQTGNSVLLNALAKIEKKIPVIKEKDVIDYTLILDDLATILESIRDKEGVSLLKIESALFNLIELSAIVAAKKYELPKEILADDRVKVELSDKQIKKITDGMSVSVATSSGSSGYVKDVSGTQINPATEEKQDTANTALSAIKTAVEIIDNAVSGSEIQVDVLTSALPSGASTETTQLNIRDYYTKAFAYNGTNIEYIGVAPAGTAKSAAGWMIKKLSYSGSDLTDIQFADGVLTFTKVWNDRATYSYS